MKSLERRYDVLVPIYKNMSYTQNNPRNTAPSGQSQLPAPSLATPLINHHSMTHVMMLSEPRCHALPLSPYYSDWHNAPASVRPASPAPHQQRCQRAILPPPRLPALSVAFNANAWAGSGRAMPAFTGGYVPCNLHANPCTLCMHGSLQSGLARKRAFKGRTAGIKKPL